MVLPFVNKKFILSSMNERISIVFVLPNLVTGGAEKVALNLMNGLNSERFSAALVTLSDEGTLHDTINQDIPHYSLDRPRVRDALPKLYSKLRELKPDIVISTMAHMNFALLLLKPFFPKTRFIVREATLPAFILKNPDPVGKQITKLLYRWLYPKADMVISPAQIIIDDLRGKLGVKTDNHVILLNPLDLKDIDSPEEDTCSVVSSPRDIRFLCVGRLDYLKGYDRLISVLPDLQMGQSWHLDIVGEGSEYTHLSELIKKNGLAEHVTLTGLVKKPWSHYAAADCLLLPSRCEGLPNVVLESLACGTKVIATTESGGIHEIAERAQPGAITIVDNMQGFIEAMKDVQASSRTGPRVSLLPRAFEKDAVIKEFEELLFKVSDRGHCL